MPAINPSSPVSSAPSAANLDPHATIPAAYREDRPQSAALTNYLDSSRLPMVSAQVFTNSDGDRQVILSGFVASDFGKQDAAVKARGYLGDPDLPVINRVMVRPELVASADSGGQPPPPELSSSGSYTDDQLGTAQNYESQTQQAMQSQQSETAIRTIMLLLQVVSMFF